MRALLFFVIVLIPYTSSVPAQPHDSWDDALGASIEDEFTPYLLPASFNTGAALKRTVWEAFGDDEIVSVKRPATARRAHGVWQPPIACRDGDCR
jgi:hypothetical protein